MLAGDAVRDTVGTSVVTLTNALINATPPAPMHVRIYVVVALGATA
jgi:hypothetical protein